MDISKIRTKTPFPAKQLLLHKKSFFTFLGKSISKGCFCKIIYQLLNYFTPSCNKSCGQAQRGRPTGKNMRDLKKN
jgi:hypothetical protein